MLFDWNWKVRRLRKKWDRLREKSLKKKGKIRFMLLEKLDTIEQNLRLLEERRLNRPERARIAKEIEIALAEIKEMVKMKEKDLIQSTQEVSHENRKI